MKNYSFLTFIQSVYSRLIEPFDWINWTIHPSIYKILYINYVLQNSDQLWSLIQSVNIPEVNSFGL